MFTFLWILCSSFCVLIGSIIAKQSFGTNSDKFAVIGIIICWTLLGLVQWQLLKPYLSNSYIWGLAIIVGGIIYFSLLGAGFYLAFYFLFRNGEITNLLGGSKGSTTLDIFLFL